ncbi:MAG: hypothetical protein DHS20C18_55000 [Saprospiraceae bacterium]|nr:MAG: hypothetical protein DHS20C18_55000 [Saprospiraceae bacterium]
MSTIEFINLSEQINSIVYQDGCYPEGEIEWNDRRRKANLIWQFKNFQSEHGAVIPDEIIRLDRKYSYVEIKIAKGGNDLWAMVPSYMLANQGVTSPISVFERISFKSRDDAILAGILSLQNQLKRISDRTDTNNSDKKMAMYFFRLLEEQKKPQLALF